MIEKKTNIQSFVRRIFNKKSLFPNLWFVEIFKESYVKMRFSDKTLFGNLIKLMKKQPKKKVRKSRKMEAKMEAKSNHFSSKTRPWAKQGRLIHSLCLIFEGLENRSFFDVVLGRQKINKNRALEPKRPENGITQVRRTRASRDLWPQAGAKYQRNSRKKRIKDCKADPNTP